MNTGRWHVECKAVEKLTADKALEQAIRDAAPGMVPVAVMKRNRQQPIVVMRLEDWEALIAKDGGQ